MDAFIGEIRAFAINFIPTGWLGCYGQIEQVRSYQALYSLLGTVYGGDEKKGTFGIPNLQALAPIGLGQGPGLTMRQMGKTYGEASVALTRIEQLGSHHHKANLQIPAATNLTKNTQTAPTASTSWLARTANVTSDTASAAVPSYTKNTGLSPSAMLLDGTIGMGGGNSNGTVTPHDNQQPYLPFIFCICWDGVYPPFN